MPSGRSGLELGMDMVERFALRRARLRLELFGWRPGSM